ncbi:MAG: efflux RND transporter periplasmic adaptor subunit [Verrucomicrobia bacterium]|nr:efflux RND transporter periplasmic adaptor subunit [Verrucomicrobiota bacterium]
MRVVLMLVGCLGLALSQPQAAVQRIQGITEPVRDAVLNSPVDGIIARQFFEEGSFAREGEVLLELDKSLQELEAARRTIVRDNRKKEFERMSALYQETRSVSEEDLDKKRLEYQEAEAEYELAAELLRKRRIVAPFSGFVVDWFNRDPGEGCKQNETALVRLVDTRQARFVCNLEADRGRLVREKQKVRLELGDATDRRTVEGEVIFVSPIVDAASGLLTVKVLFQNPDGNVRPGVSGYLLLED